jgi:hypothetical protein
MKAVSEGREAYEPSPLSKVSIWGCSVLHILIPLAILFLDILFDILLVISYWNNYQGLQWNNANVYEVLTSQKTGSLLMLSFG